MNASPETQTETRRATQLVALCCAVYFTSYLTRKGYDASILAICDETDLARSAAGLASTAAVALYGSGQFVTGALADRFDARKIVLGALLLTAACNALMPVVVGCVPAMVALWAVNGFAQAMFWPPLVKIVAANLRPGAYRGAIFWISVSCNVASLAVYLLVSSCIRISGWQLAFAISVTAALAVAVLWRVAAPRLAPESGLVPRTQSPGAEKTSASAGIPIGRLIVAAGLIPAMAAIVCQGFLRDGIEVWAPTIVSDLYRLGTSGSIFSAALLPVFSVMSMAGSRLLRRWLGDEMKAAITLFGLGLACASLLFATDGATLAIGLPLLALLSASMHGTNLMLIGELPGRFARYGRVGTISGLLNAFTYIGAAISIYGFPILHERFQGWRPVFAIWMGILALGLTLTCLARRSFRSFTQKAKE
ncbi:MAG: MFS transporter [Kiritimatiellia bacterium]|jgi:OPA family glycerol-3-phosphate transporter-like MFS transporter